MAVYHRTQRLQIYGNKPEVEQLFGNRYRMTVRCIAKNDTEAWYDKNKDQIFANFGTLYDAEMSIDGIPSRTGEAYANMALVKNEASYTQTGEYVIVFTYETLTDQFVQNVADKVDFEVNGLMRITRSVVALNGSEYSKEVGTSSSITSKGHGPSTDDPVTLYLSRALETSKRDYEVGYIEVVETWLQAGILNRGTVDMDDGSLQQRVTSYLAVEPTALGIVIRRDTGSFEGLSTFTVTEILDSAGSALSSTSPNLVKTTSSISSFSVPGLVSLRENTNTEFTTETDGTILGNNYINFSFDLRGPIDVSCPTQTLEYLQTENQIQSADYKLGSATGLWSPGSWASSRVTGIDKKNKPFSVSKAYRGYRAPENLIRFEEDPETGSKFASGLERYISSPRSLSNASLTGRRMNVFIDGYEMANKIPPIIEIGGGPENPVGKKYVTNITIQPDFKDIDGVVYYRKTVTVKDVKGDAVDDASSGDSTDNMLASYTADAVTAVNNITSANATAYTLELDASLHSEEDDYYQGALLEVYARDLNSTNAFKDLQRFMVSSYNPESNKILLVNNLNDNQAAGRYNSGTESDITNYDFARIKLSRYDVNGTVVYNTKYTNSYRNITVTGEFTPFKQQRLEWDGSVANTNYNIDYSGWSLKVGVNSFPILALAADRRTKSNSFRIATTNLSLAINAGDNFTLVPPVTYTWPAL
jgi:hypothetical protein